MRNDYRGRMDIWFKTVLLFVVFNKVHLYRQLMNTTCLELAKPSNKHLRLSCNDSSIYHCLLNGNNTNEFEICKMWIWIPEGNCAYLNEYGRNIDARRCSSSAELGCPKTLYRSKETIKYAACYVKKNNNSKASSSSVASNWTSSGGNGENASSSRISETAEKHIEIKSVIFFLYIIVIAVILFISTIFYIQRYMGKGLWIKEKFDDCVEDPLNNYDTGNDITAKKQVDDQVKAGNEIESDKDSRVLFDFASESFKKKLPQTGR